MKESEPTSMGTSLWVSRPVRQRIALAIVALAATLVPMGWTAGWGLFYPPAIVGVLAWLYLKNLLAPTAGPVVIDPESVRCDELRIERAAIRRGYFSPATSRRGATVVLLDERDRVLGRIGVANEASANEVLTELRLAAHQATAPFHGFVPRGWPGAIASSVGVVVGMLVMAVGLSLHQGLLFPFGAAIMFASQVLLGMCRYEVGADGILVGDRLGGRFIRWRDVHAVERTPRGIALEVGVGRRRIEMPLVRRASKRARREIGPEGAFFARANAAFEAYRRSAPPDVSALVARGGRTRAAWLEALAAASGEGGFRVAPIAPETLLEVALSATAEDTARAGAAVILGRTGDAADRARLRVAAEACASPRLRVVLEKAADASPTSEVEEALGAIEEDDERAAARLS